MNTRAVEVCPLAQEVSFTDDEFIVSLADGRNITVPLVWFPRPGGGDKRTIAELRNPRGR